MKTTMPLFGDLNALEERLVGEKGCDDVDNLLELERMDRWLHWKDGRWRMENGEMERLGKRETQQWLKVNTRKVAVHGSHPYPCNAFAWPLLPPVFPFFLSSFSFFSSRLPKLLPAPLLLPLLHQEKWSEEHVLAGMCLRNKISGGNITDMPQMDLYEGYVLKREQLHA